MTDNRNVQTVKALLESFQRGDIKGVLAKLTPDVEIQMAGPPAQIPWAGRHRGPAQAERLFGTLEELVQYDAFDPVDYLASGEKVAAIIHERWRSKTTGRASEQELILLFTLRNGQVARVQSFEDTIAQAAALTR